MKLSVNQRQTGSIVVLDLDGHLALGDDLTRLNELITGLVEANQARIVLNLKKVAYVDSSGAGTLVRCFSAAKQAGGALKLAEPNDRFRKVLELTQLNKVLPLFATESDALASFK